MALDSSKVRVAVTGAISKGLLSATAPTTAAAAATGFTDLGYVGEDGVTYSAAGEGDSTPIKAWQNGAVVRTIRSATEENPSWNFVLLETKIETIETYFGVTVTSTSTEGSYVIDTNTVRTHSSYVIDVIDGSELIRVYIPRGIVTEVGDIVYANGEAIGYEITLEGERDSVKGFNAKTFATALKTVA